MSVRLGLRENLPQFSLLVAVNAFVGAMVGLERATLPLVGREDFGVASKTAVLSFIVAFGLAKALTNLGAGGFAARLGRRRLLIAGWTIALPVPMLIAVAGRRAGVGGAHGRRGNNQGRAGCQLPVPERGRPQPAWVPQPRRRSLPPRAAG